MRIPTLMFIAGAATTSLLGQNADPSRLLVGFWQAQTPVVSGNRHDNYRFYTDGTFTFGFSSYNATKRIWLLKGAYSLKENSISFLIQSRVEWVGGKIVHDQGSANGEWALADAELTTVRQSNPPPESMELIFVSAVGATHPCITIDGRKYFQVSPNPERGLSPNLNTK